MAFVMNICVCLLSELMAVISVMASHISQKLSVMLKLCAHAYQIPHCYVDIVICKNPHYFLYSLPMNKVRTKRLGTTETLPLNKVRTKRLGTTEIVLFKYPWLPDYTHALPQFAHYKANCNTNTHCCYYNNLHLQLMHLHSQFTKFCHNTVQYLL